MFKTQVTVSVPHIPVTRYPEHNEQNVSAETDFTWDNVTDADLYNIQVSSDSTFEQLFIDTVIKNDTFIQDIQLEHAAKWYWRVRAASGDLRSLWSDIKTFTTGMPDLPQDEQSKPLDLKSEFYNAMKKGSLKHADEIVGRLSEKDADKNRLRIILIEGYIDNVDFKKAKSHADKLNMDDAMVNFLHGRIMLGEQRFSEAAVELESALRKKTVFDYKKFNHDASYYYALARHEQFMLNKTKRNRDFALRAWEVIVTLYRNEGTNKRYTTAVKLSLEITKTAVTEEED